MKKIIINENQRGLLFNNGKFIKLLNPGKYHVYGGRSIEIMPLEECISSQNCSLDTLLKSADIANSVSVVDVEDQHIALHFVDGRFSSALKCGKYAYWNINENHTFELVDISNPKVSDDIPQYIFSKISTLLFYRFEVSQYRKALLYFDEKFQRVLDAGVYYFWRGKVKIELKCVDTRLTQLNVTGQEIMTQDKVSLRINFVCNYRITDYVKILTEIDDYTEQIHITAQLAIRDYVSKYKLDEILQNKDELSEFVLKRLKAKEKELYVEFSDAGVKDIILPGEIRNIMNTVLIAEKKAQASVITRREEVASTRSLLNTAKLMDENATLYRLKELEYIERICENVGSINLNGNCDIVAQLASLIQGKRE